LVREKEGRGDYDAKIERGATVAPAGVQDILEVPGSRVNGNSINGLLLEPHSGIMV
jgi:hypothetical protein